MEADGPPFHATPNIGGKMTRQRFSAFLPALFLLAALCCSAAFAAEAPRKGILIAAFGTSVAPAQVSYAAIDKEVKKTFPDHEILWAWTARTLLHKRPRNDQVLSVQEAMARFAAMGVKEVVVFSLHVIPGREYEDLATTVRAFAGLPKGLEKVSLSPPLLYDTESLDRTAGLLLKNIPPARKADEAVLFIGHGTHHPAGVYYPALQYYLSQRDGNAFVGTVEGDLDVVAVTAALRARGIKKVWLAPMMMVAGDHAVNDLFGDEPDSWARRLNAVSIRVEPISKGLGEFPNIVEQRISDLRGAMEHDTPK